MAQCSGFHHDCSLGVANIYLMVISAIYDTKLCIARVYILCSWQLYHCLIIPCCLWIIYGAVISTILTCSASGRGVLK